MTFDNACARLEYIRFLNYARSKSKHTKYGSWRADSTRDGAAGDVESGDGWGRNGGSETTGTSNAAVDNGATGCNATGSNIATGSETADGAAECGTASETSGEPSDFEGGTECVRAKNRG